MMARIFTLSGTALLLVACTAPLMTTSIPTASVAQTTPAAQTDAAGNAPTGAAAACSVGGVELFGRVRIVERGGDVRVKMVERFADLKVDPFAIVPNDCGEWKFVERNEDFTIRFVESNPDIEIELVRHLPGMR